MKITSIVKQKREGRYNIFLDNEFAFGLLKETIYKFGLRLNDNIDQKQINEILEFDEFLKAQKFVYKLLSHYSYTVNEIIQKLRKKKIKPTTIDKVVNNIIEQGLVNDNEYVKLYIESKKLTKPIGKKLLKLKLKNKGIDQEIIDSQLEQLYSSKEEKAAAEKVLARYIKTLKEKDLKKRKEKCFRHLISKGFDFDLIEDILRDKFDTDFNNI